MFQEIDIRRFRGFQQLRINSLDRFNLIIGRNSVGKTSLLEGIFLLLGPTNPELPLRTNVFRGIEQVKNDPEDLWGWLFYKKDFTRAIDLQARTDDGKQRKLYITLKEPKEVRVANGEKRTPVRRSVSSTSTTDTAPAELLLKYHAETGSQFHTRAFIKESGLGFDRAKPLVLPTSVYVGSRAGYTSDNAERFSKLEEVGKEGEILPALRLLEPRLKRLAILATTSGPMIHGDVGIGRMVPVVFMGDGIGRLLTLLLAITASSDGIVLIDEIESGFHYSILAAVWAALAEASRSLNVQIIATTHSWECLKAAHESFSSGTEHDLRVHRLDRKEADGIGVVTYDQEMLETALVAGMELR